MIRPGYGLMVVLLAAACGGGESSNSSAQGAAGASDEDVDACSLLTAEEIQAAAGWAPDTTAGKTYGTTNTCAFTGPDALKQTVVIVVARPTPKMSSSAELSKWRNDQAARQPDFKMVITPVEELGVPAVSSKLEGTDNPTIEAAVNGRLLGVTAPSLEVSKALVPKAAARLK
jgi:hypothetical protein